MSMCIPLKLRCGFGTNGRFIAASSGYSEMLSIKRSISPKSKHPPNRRNPKKTLKLVIPAYNNGFLHHATYLLRRGQRATTPVARTQRTETPPVPTQEVGDGEQETEIIDASAVQAPSTPTEIVVQPPQQEIPDGVNLSLLDFEDVQLKTNLFKTYIVAEAGDKIFFIDQHVAAERVLYERFVNQMQAEGIPVQGLLLPVTLEATPQQLSTLKVHGDIFNKLGFDLEEFGGNTILIRAIPSPLPTRVAAQTITDLLDKLPEAPHTEVQLPEAIDNALITLACKSAVKAGDTLDTKEMINLIKELSEAKLPFNCPHSRPIIVEMGRDELERRFHR